MADVVLGRKSAALKSADERLAEAEDALRTILAGRKRGASRNAALDEALASTQARVRAMDMGKWAARFEADVSRRHVLFAENLDRLRVTIRSLLARVREREAVDTASAVAQVSGDWVKSLEAHQGETDAVLERLAEVDARLVALRKTIGIESDVAFLDTFRAAEAEIDVLLSRADAIPDVLADGFASDGGSGKDKGKGKSQGKGKASGDGSQLAVGRPAAMDETDFASIRKATRQLEAEVKFVRSVSAQLRDRAPTGEHAYAGVSRRREPASLVRKSTLEALRVRHAALQAEVEAVHSRTTDNCPSCAQWDAKSEQVLERIRLLNKGAAHHSRAEAADRERAAEARRRHRRTSVMDLADGASHAGVDEAAGGASSANSSTLSAAAPVPAVHLAPLHPSRAAGADSLQSGSAQLNASHGSLPLAAGNASLRFARSPAASHASSSASLSRTRLVSRSALRTNEHRLASTKALLWEHEFEDQAAAVTVALFHPVHANIFCTCHDSGRLAFWRIDVTGGLKGELQQARAEMERCIDAQQRARAAADAAVAEEGATAATVSMVDLALPDAGDGGGDAELNAIQAQLLRAKQLREAADAAQVAAEEAERVVDALEAEEAAGAPDRKTHVDLLVDVRRAHADSIRSAAFSRDGNMLATAGDDGAVFLWDAEMDEEEEEEAKAEAEKAGAVASGSAPASPAAQRFAGGAARRRRGTGRGGLRAASMRTVTMSVQDMLEMSSDDGEMYGQTRFGEQLEFALRLPTGSTVVQPLHSVAFDRSGCNVVIGAYKTIQIVDLGTSQPIRKWDAHELNVYTLDTHPTLAAVVASGGDDRVVRIWDVAPSEPRCLDVVRHDASWVHCVRFAPGDGTRLLVAYQANLVLVRDWRAGTTLGIIEGFRDAVTVLQPFRLSSFGDELLLMSASADAHVRFHSVRRRVAVAEFPAQLAGQVRAAALSADAGVCFLVTAGADRTLKVWNRAVVMDARGPARR